MLVYVSLYVCVLMQAKKFLLTNEFESKVKQNALRATLQGVSGVPHFIFDKKYSQHTHAHTHKLAYTHTQSYTRTHAYTHTHTHTHTPNKSKTN